MKAPTGHDAIAQGNALGIQRPTVQALKGRNMHASIPHIPFIKRDTVFGQQSTVFVLKRHLAMMLRLMGNVGLQRRAMRGADGKDPVTALPMETRISSALGLQPLGRSRLDLLHQLRRRTGARVSDQQVDVVGHGTRLQQRALLVLHDAADVGVEFIPNVIRQPRFAPLRGEDQMHQDLSERLRHGDALSGLGWVGDAIPRALPWAFTGCPFGAGRNALFAHFEFWMASIAHIHEPSELWYARRRIRWDSSQ